MIFFTRKQKGWSFLLKVNLNLKKRNSTQGYSQRSGTPFYVISFNKSPVFLCLVQTFLTLSLQDMASRVQLSGPQEAEKYVLHMVSWSTDSSKTRHLSNTLIVLTTVQEVHIYCVLKLLCWAHLSLFIYNPACFLSLFMFLSLLYRLKMARSMLALTKRMAWSAFTTTPKNTTTQQCSTKLTKRWKWLIYTQTYNNITCESSCFVCRKFLKIWFFSPVSLQMLKCIELDEKLKSMDQEITVNPQFVQKVRQHLTGSNMYIWAGVEITNFIYSCCFN